MSQVEVRLLCKRFGQIRASEDVSFIAKQGTFVVLLGPSGCGKSTILRMIAGLEQPTSGKVFIDARDVTSVDPAQRKISMVFQSYALFPHLGVAENILFGLKVRRVPQPEREKRLKRVAELVGLEELLFRKPSQLSGGQQQRVALARAIIAEHPVCLMDEPLSNLDAKLRHEMRLELRALQRRLGMTVLYVTHDQTEAMSMADQVILLNAGHIEQKGAPEALYHKPATTFVADFIGTPPMNLINVNAYTQKTALRYSRFVALVNTANNGDCILGIRPEHLHISQNQDCLPVTVSSEDYHGADTIVGVRIGSDPDNLKHVEIMVRIPGRVYFQHGQKIGLVWDEKDMHIFSADGRRKTGVLREE